MTLPSVNEENNRDDCGARQPMAPAESRAYCDDCIAKQLELSRRGQASRITRALSTTSNFLRDKGACSICGAVKKVIEAV